MTIATDFTTQHNNKNIAELAIKFRANIEYTKRVLDEQIDITEKVLIDKHYADIPASIKNEGTVILNEMKAFRDKLEKDHSEFLKI